MYCHNALTHESNFEIKEPTMEFTLGLFDNYVLPAPGVLEQTVIVFYS